MDKYDYRRALTDDIKDWIVNDTDIMDNGFDELRDDELPNWIYDEVWNEDSVTGNSSYFYNTEEKCSEYLSGNYDILYEAAHEFNMDDEINILIKYYENKSLARYFDCTIRCYLLSECIGTALKELINETATNDKNKVQNTESNS